MNKCDFEEVAALAYQQLLEAAQNLDDWQFMFNGGMRYRHTIRKFMVSEIAAKTMKFSVDGIIVGIVELPERADYPDFGSYNEALIEAKAHPIHLAFSALENERNRRHEADRCKALLKALTVPPEPKPKPEPPIEIKSHPVEKSWFQRIGEWLNRPIGS